MHYRVTLPPTRRTAVMGNVTQDFPTNRQALNFALQAQSRRQRTRENAVFTIACLEGRKVLWTREYPYRHFPLKERVAKENRAQVRTAKTSQRTLHDKPESLVNG